MNRSSSILTVAVSFVVAVLVVLTLYGTRKRYSLVVPDQKEFRSNDANRRATEWLSKRWDVSDENIYTVVQDSEPWMQVFGMFEIQTLTSARVWVLDTSHKEGEAWEESLLRQGLPHEGNIYLFREFVPRENEISVAAKFYSTRTFWQGSLDGKLAIIEDIQWTDFDKGSGIIKAYQSQKYLPSITITIANGVPKKWRVSQTPVD